jgi:hypothetical protein
LVVCINSFSFSLLWKVFISFCKDDTFV